jgi:aspartyl protease family protein
MTRDPWSQPPRPSPRARRRIWLGLLLALAGVAALVGLARLTAGRELSGGDWGYVGLRGLMLVLAISALLAQGLNLGRTLKYGLIWLGLGAVLMLGFTFRDELGFAAARVGSEFAPGAAMQTRPGEMVIARDMDGAFYVLGQVNGAPVRFLVDTGASEVVLSPADARRAGFDVDAMDFSRTFQTANGIGRGAELVADSLSIGSVGRRDVRIAVNQAPMGTSLLGMSFFRHLTSVEIRGDRLYLRWES